MTQALNLTSVLTKIHPTRLFSFLDSSSKPEFVQWVTEDSLSCSQVSRAWNRMAEQSVWQPARVLRFPSIARNSPNLKAEIIERSKAIEAELRKTVEGGSKYDKFVGAVPGLVAPKALTIEQHPYKVDMLPYKMDSRVEWARPHGARPTVRPDEFTAIYPIYGRNNLFGLQYGPDNLVLCDASTMKPHARLSHETAQDMLAPFHFAHGRLIFRSRNYTTVAYSDKIVGEGWYINSVDLGKPGFPTKQTRLPIPECQPIFTYFNPNPEEHRPSIGIVDEMVICGYRSPDALNFTLYDVHTLERLGQIVKRDSDIRTKSTVPFSRLACQVYTSQSHYPHDFQFPIGGKKGILHLVMQHHTIGPVTMGKQILDATPHYFSATPPERAFGMELWDIRRPAEPKFLELVPSMANAVGQGPRYYVKRFFVKDQPLDKMGIWYEKRLGLSNDDYGTQAMVYHNHKGNYLAELNFSFLFLGDIVIALNSRQAQIVDFQKSAVTQLVSVRSNYHTFVGIHSTVHLIDGMLSILHANGSRGTGDLAVGIDYYNFTGKENVQIPKPQGQLLPAPQPQPQPQQPAQPQPQPQPQQPAHPEPLEYKRTPPPRQQPQTAAPKPVQAATILESLQGGHVSLDTYRQRVQRSEYPKAVTGAPAYKREAGGRGSSLHANAPAFVPGALLQNPSDAQTGESMRDFQKRIKAARRNQP